MTTEVTLPKALPASPWRGLLVVVQQTGSAERPTAADEWIALLKAADQVAAVQLILRDPENGRLWVERLNQARYWTKSQARQLARHLAWEHVDILTSSTKA